MTIVVTGGGSGGHITPLLAVASELKQLRPDVRIVYIGQRGDQFVKVVAEHPEVDAAHVIWAGKWRRYHGESLLKKLFDFKTVFFNIRDAFLVVLGCLQSFFLLGRLRPSVVFIKGGFVGVPVGKAAGWRNIPYITHDSDAIPGLANRLVAKKAAMHAVALPKELYKGYPQDKTVTVGVPIVKDYQRVDGTQMQSFRLELGIRDANKVLFVTGGGLGAQKINQAMVQIVPQLLEINQGLYIIHNTGKALAEATKRAYDEVMPVALKPRLVLKDYLTDMYKYSGAADLVVTRAGATAMAEFAAQAKPTVVIPNPLLAGGHQLKNAAAFEQAGAAKIITEADLKADPARLQYAIQNLLENPADLATLGAKLHTFTHFNSARELAELLLSQIPSKKP